MGASAGTGVRGFAEGGSTSTPSSSAPAAPQRAIYQPQYTDYGLSSTPQAQGILGSALNMGSYGNQMPTFTRPQAVQQTPSYSIPYGNKQNTILGVPVKSLMNSMAANQNITKSLMANSLTQDQYDRMMDNPSLYLPYVKSVQAGEAAQLGYQQQPIQFMTQDQRTKYNQRLSRELDSLLRPITVFDVEDQGGS